MEVNEENISKILSVLAHPLRRQILRYLSEKEEAAFTDFATAFMVDTGKLSFHLRTLEAFVEQTQSGKYRLSRLGRHAIVLLQDVGDWDVEIETKARSFRGRLAKGRTRVGAFLVDFFIIFALFLALSNVFYPFTREFVYDVSIPFFLVLFWVYSTIFEGFRGQTLGKRLNHTKVARIDGKDPSLQQAAIRNFGKAFLLPFDLAFGLSQKDRRFMRFFDKYTRTTVISLEPKPLQTLPKKATAYVTSQSQLKPNR